MHGDVVYTLADVSVFIGIVTTAITGMFVAIITAWRTGAKIDKVGACVEVVERNTNSTFAAQAALIVKLNADIAALMAELAKQIQPTTATVTTVQTTERTP